MMTTLPQNSIETDEEGYNVRPENPWADSDGARSNSSSSDDDDDDSDLTSPSEKTFKGIKVGSSSSSAP